MGKHARFRFAAAVIIAVTVFLSLPASAEVPKTINYQGMLRTTAGQPVNDSVQMRFSLYTSGTGTPALWTETQPAVQVTNGRYQVTLGSVTPINLPFDQQYFLGITVGADPEMSPRQELTSVPYAMKAVAADNVSTSGQIVSSVTTGTAPFQVSSTTMVPNLNADMVGGMHANDFVQKAGDTMTGTLTLSNGNLELPSTTASAGVIKQGGANLIHTYGTGNFFAGTNAGNLTTTGNYNTVSGSAALSSNTTGYSNTASGYAALSSNTTGGNNTASGSAALYSNTTGINNTASGINALYNNTTGNYNIASGSNSLQQNTIGSYNTASGYGALLYNTTGGNNTASGSAALYSNTTGINNTASGYYALSSNTTGSYNTGIGYNANVGSGGLSNATAIGYGAVVSASNYVRIGNTAVTQIGGQVAWSNLSDIRIKKDIEDINYGLSFIKQLRPVQYKLKQGNDHIDFGFIAQEVEFLLGTNYNVLGIGGDADRMLSLRYTDFIAPLVRAVQEQQEQIESQKTKIDAQQSAIEELRAEIEAIKALLGAK